MTKDPTASLREARDAFQAQRDFFVRRIEELDGLITNTNQMIKVLVEGEPGGSTPSVSSGVATTHDTPTIRERVLGVLADGQAHHFNHFARALGQTGPPVKDTSLRGVVARMKKDGEICLVAPGSPRCWAVSSSDSAPMLCALDARVRLVSETHGEREVAVESLFRDDGTDTGDDNGDDDDDDTGDDDNGGNDDL